MIHSEFKELIILASLDELDDFYKHKLSEHLMNCTECKEELSRMKILNSEVNVTKPQFDNIKLLDQARRELRHTLSKGNIKKNLFEEVWNFIFPYKMAIGGIILFIIGIGTGLLFSGMGKQSTQAAGYELLDQTNIKISNLNFIDSDPADGEISFAFDAIKPVTIRGKVSDNNIQQILAHSLLNEKNDGIRLRTLNTIAAQTQISGIPGIRIKSVLIKTIKYDANPGVRREALILLNRLQLDQEIIDALLYVLENDSNAGLRVAAINSFDPKKLNETNIDLEGLNILEQKTRNDENEYIKLRARTVIEEVTNESL